MRLKFPYLGNYFRSAWCFGAEKDGKEKKGRSADVSAVAAAPAMTKEKQLKIRSPYKTGSLFFRAKQLCSRKRTKSKEVFP